ncbi:MAG TPA: hypothetical protein VHL60_03740 [Oxalicibacterium sp.]|jgi:hypothetical protein|nr:hypothetical protein [Oxalicibacterium sp.]
MYRNETYQPCLSLQATMATQKDKKHGSEDNTHSHSEEHPRASRTITVVPFSRVSTGSFQ